MDNKERGALFKAAYKRAQRALKAGFYLEAIVLCESLILDRLSLIHVSNLDLDIRRASAGTLANSLKSNRIHSFDANLWDDCLAWTSKRNKHAHHLANISTDETTKWRNRLIEARRAAEAGFALVNRVSVESRKHKI